MKNFILTSSVTFFILQAAYSQVAYYDALEIKSKYINISGTSFSFKNDAVSKHDLSAYLRNYLPDNIKNDLTRTEGEILSKFVKNPFIGPQISSAFFGGGAASVSAGLFTSIGSTNITPLADGLVKFLIERGKEELNISFFQKFQNLIIVYPEIGILFPNTKILIKNFEYWEYANVINTLRESFDKDLKGLLQNIPQLAKLNVADCLSNKPCQARVNAITNFFGTNDGRIFLSSVILGDCFANSKKLPDAINEIASINYLGGLTNISADVKNGIQLINCISYSLKSKDFGKHYVNKNDFVTISNDDIARNLYLGLLFQQLDSKGVNFSFITNIVPSGSDKSVFIKGIIDYSQAILSQGDDLNTALNNFITAKKKGEEDLEPSLGGVFESAQSFLRTAMDIQKINSSLTIPIVLQNVTDYSQTTLTVAHDIIIKNYSAAIVGTLTFITQKLPNNDFTKELVKYGSFAANVVQSKNSDDVKSAITAIALPSGSASIKKNTHFNIALNAYIGGFWGNEFLATEVNSKWSPIAGAYAPIGVTFSKPLNFPFKGGAVSIFGSLLDISSFASFRLKDPNTEQLPEVTLKNIFAPGIGLVYGIPKVPISIGYINQLGPALRNITATQVEASENPNKRWLFFLSIDIPLINFYSR